MGKKEGNREDFKPFISVILFICFLFSVVFFKTEIRRLGYSVLRLSQMERKLLDQQKLLRIHLARLNRSSYIEKVAQKDLTLKKAQSQQVIMLTGTMKQDPSL